MLRDSACLSFVRKLVLKIETTNFACWPSKLPVHWRHGHVRRLLGEFKVGLGLLSGRGEYSE